METLAGGSRLSSSAPTFVPRSSKLSVNGVGSPNGFMSNLEANGVTTTDQNGVKNSPCSTSQQDSDCGSSSGLGSKNQEMVSDEGSSASGQQFLQTNTYRPSLLPDLPPMPISPGFPHHPRGWLHPTPPGTNNDLYVHVQHNETLSLMVGGDIQHINGPATVRMVGESGIAPSALPINVPPGHIIHQIVDETGVLRHLILSSDSSFLPNPTPAGLPGRMHHPYTPYHSQFYTVNRKWPQQPQHTMQAPHKFVPEVAKTVINGVREDETEMEIDTEDCIMLKQMLCRILPPQIINVNATEAEIYWQELDTSEASAAGGPFPQIDASEFTYQICLFEGCGRHVTTHNCLPDDNKVILTNLTPDSDYYVQLRAFLVERGIDGDASQAVSFKTCPDRPGSPIMPKINSRQGAAASISWRTPNNNGSPIIRYTVYISKKDGRNMEKLWDGLQNELKLTNLFPGIYRLQVTATNREGESAPSASVQITIPNDGPPLQPPPPTVAGVTARGVRLTWNCIADYQYSLEMNEVELGEDAIHLVRDKITGGICVIQELHHGSEYRFRLQYHTVNADSEWSDWVHVRTSGRHIDRIPAERVLVPSKPQVVSRTKRKAEIVWKTTGAKDREFTYHLEGSTFNHPNKFRTLYKGYIASCLITEEDIQNIRVQTINKKGVSSDFSETLVLPFIEDENACKPPALESPVLRLTGLGVVRAKWNTPIINHPSSSYLLYEVRRVDGKGDILYSGPEEFCLIDGLGQKPQIEIQVRAVLVSQNGSRLEGDWSGVGKITAHKEPPRPPKELKIAADMSYVTWTAPETNGDLRYRIYCSEIVEGKHIDEKIYDTTDCRHHFFNLAFSKNYSCRVVAYHEGGDSLPSEEIFFSTSAAVPAPPEGVSLDAISTSDLCLRWSDPDSRGEPILQYRIIVENKGEVIRDISVLPSTSTSNEFIISTLSPDTSYRVEISAKNSVGSGVAATITGRTRPLPPNAPALHGDVEPTSIRLRWKPIPSDVPLTYKIARVSYEDGKQTFLYEGDSSSFKVRGLSENTEYHFQIRCNHKENGYGPWSEIHSFRTTLIAPPAFKHMINATEKNNMYYLDWQHILNKKTHGKKFFYRLQAMDSGTEEKIWNTVYEGTGQSYTLQPRNFKGVGQVRIACVRSGLESGQEMCGNFSSITYLPLLAQEKQRDDLKEEPPLPESMVTVLMNKMKSMSHTHCIHNFSIFVLVTLLCCLLGTIFSSWLTYQANMHSDKSSPPTGSSKN